MSKKTNNSMRQAMVSFPPHSAVAIFGLVEWPDQTVVSIIQNRRADEFLGSAIGRRLGVAMLFKARIMLIAETQRAVRRIASLD